MSGDVERLDHLAIELEAVVDRLQRLVASAGDVGPAPTGSSLAAMRRIWLVRERIADIADEVGRPPDYLVGEMYELVGQRLSSDEPDAVYGSGTPARGVATARSDAATFDDRAPRDDRTVAVDDRRGGRRPG